MTYSEPMVAACNQSKIKEIIGLRSQGMNATEISKVYGHADTTISRWMRVYDRYGEAVFARDPS